MLFCFCIHFEFQFGIMYCATPPQDGHWLLASYHLLKLYPPPTQNKLLCFARQLPTNGNDIFKPKGMRTYFWFEKNLRQLFFFFSFLFHIWLMFLSRTKFCHADLEQHAILLKKVEVFRTKLLRSSFFSGEKIGTILSRRSRISRTSRAPSRLSRPRPIDCDAGPKQTMNTFPVFGQFFFRTSSKKVFSKGPPSSPDLHPKRSP